MKIAHILAQKPSSTGSGIYLSETIRAFAEEGAEQALVAGIAPGEEYRFPDGVGFFPVVFETEGLPFPVCGMSDQMPYKATRYRDMDADMVQAFYRAFDDAVDRMLAQMQPDLVICHHLYLLTAHLAMRDWPCPIVGISHNTDIRQFQRIPLEREAIARGIARLDRVLALTGAQADTIAQVYGIPRDGIDIIGTGYNDRFFTRGDMARKKPHSIAYVGKLWKAKGVPNLARAIELRPDEYADVQARLVGGYSDEAERDWILDVIGSCKRKCEYLGVVSQEDLIRVYREAEVFVLPSFSEGLPLVVLEALACGCKVVLTDLPGLRDWLARSAPGAPVVFVDAPVDAATGLPNEGDFPRFERELARAIERAFRMELPEYSVEHLSWRSVCRRMLAAESG